MNRFARFALVCSLAATPAITFAQSAGQDMKDAGHHTKEAAKATGSGIKKGTIKGAEATKKGAVEVGDKTEDGWDATKHGTKKAAGATKKGAVEVADKTEDGWDATKSGTKKAWDKTKSGTKKAANKIDGDPKTR